MPVLPVTIPEFLGRKLCSFLLRPVMEKIDACLIPSTTCEHTSHGILCLQVAFLQVARLVIVGGMLLRKANLVAKGLIESRLGRVVKKAEKPRKIATKR